MCGPPGVSNTDMMKGQARPGIRQNLVLQLLHLPSRVDDLEENLEESPNKININSPKSRRIQPCQLRQWSHQRSVHSTPFS